MLLQQIHYLNLEFQLLILAYIETIVCITPPPEVFHNQRYPDLCFTIINSYKNLPWGVSNELKQLFHCLLCLCRY